MTDQTEDTKGEDDPTRAWARALFAPDEPMFGADEPDDTTATDEPDEPETPTGNYVPNEGNNPKPKDDSDLALVRLLFDN